MLNRSGHLSLLQWIKERLLCWILISQLRVPICLLSWMHLSTDHCLEAFLYILEASS